MKIAADILNPLIKRAGTGVVTVFLLLLCSGLSWGDTTVYVYQAATTGALTVKTVGSDGSIMTVSQTNNPPVNVPIPNSCFTPDLFWDSASGALRLNGFDSDNDPAWTGTINASGKFTSLMTTLPAITCTTTAPSIVSGIFPEAIPCTSYPAYGACSNGFMTRDATPAGCADPLHSIPCPTTVTPCSWQYSGWIPSDSSCTPGQPQFRTPTGTPEGCIGAPTQETVKLCPPQACTDYTYTSWSSCTNSLQTRSVTGNLPAGCTGTPSASPVLSQGCTQTIACTGYTYTDWSTDCVNNQRTRSVVDYTPANCSGTPSTSAVTTQSCSSGGGTGTYQPLSLNCGSGTASPIANGTYLYSFTVPKGTYSYVWVAYQQSDSYVWSEQVVIKKDGNVTVDEYTDLMANFATNSSLNSQIASGANDLWYKLKRSGDTMGSTISIKTSGDGVITSTSNTTTLSRDVPFTMVLSAGDVGPNKVPSNKTHKIRYCYKIP